MALVESVAMSSSLFLHWDVSNGAQTHSVTNNSAPAKNGKLLLTRELISPHHVVVIYSSDDVHGQRTSNGDTIPPPSTVDPTTDETSSIRGQSMGEGQLIRIHHEITMHYTGHRRRPSHCAPTHLVTNESSDLWAFDYLIMDNWSDMTLSTFGHISGNTL